VSDLFSGVEPNVTNVDGVCFNLKFLGRRRTMKLSIIILITTALFILTLPAYAQYPAYGWHNVQIVGGGFTTGIIYNQTEPNLVYILTDMGGAYRFNPVTNRWVPLLDWVGWDAWNFTGVESIASDPIDPNRVYIAAGTYSNSWAGNGAMLCSTDKGKTFTTSNLSFKLGGNMPGRSMGERLLILT
jgi:xyloglucan-specific exo-beta-1,4-glucanase